MRLRKIHFWIHLVTGLVASLLIAVMSFTGAALAYEHELVAWAERDVRRVAVPEGAAHLSLTELRQRLAEAKPDLKQVGVTLSAEPDAAVVFSSGREGLSTKRASASRVDAARPAP